MKSVRALLILVFLAFVPSGTHAQDMAFPLVCEPGVSCFILSYPDMDANPDKARDFACGPSASEGDPFLRIALPDVSAIPLNAPVIAAAAGRVKDVNDGVADLVISGRGQLKTGSSLCGNGVIIDHGEGLNTSYCHLKHGSLKVVRGQHVVKGQVIGFAGQSGLATWPQLAFSASRNGFFLDPMTGKTDAEGCGFKPRPIIDLPVPFKAYQPAAIVSMGFSLAPVATVAIATGKAPRFVQISPEEKTINMWALLLGVKRGDGVKATLRDPRGRIFEARDVTIEADTDRQLINVTRTRGFVNWREGIYTGEIEVTRDVEHKPMTVTREVTVLLKMEDKAEKRP